MKAIFALFLSLLVAPAIAQVQSLEVQADYIQYRYVHFYGKPITRKRAKSYAYFINDFSQKCGLDPDWELAQISYESAFGNSIFNKRLAFKKWSYGLTNLTIQTSKELVKQLHLSIEISGNFLIEDYRENILLGCAQMASLKAQNKGSLKKAMIAYNVGQRGMLLGWGGTYFDHVKQEHDLWIKFKKEELK